MGDLADFSPLILLITNQDLTPSLGDPFSGDIQRVTGAMVVEVSRGKNGGE